MHGFDYTDGEYHLSNFDICKKNSFFIFEHRHSYCFLLYLERHMLNFCYAVINTESLTVTVNIYPTVLCTISVVFESQWWYGLFGFVFMMYFK